MPACLKFANWKSRYIPVGCPEGLHLLYVLINLYFVEIHELNFPIDLESGAQGQPQRWPHGPGAELRWGSRGIALGIS